jgi:hypothetical protein
MTIWGFTLWAVIVQRSCRRVGMINAKAMRDLTTINKAELLRKQEERLSEQVDQALEAAQDGIGTTVEIECAVYPEAAEKILGTLNELGYKVYPSFRKEGKHGEWIVPKEI